MSSSLNIGDLLYRYVKIGGVFIYKVIGIRIYDDQTLYELESQSCTHGWKCKLLVGGKINQLRYISMTNDDEEDSQHYWHTDNSAFRFIKEEAELDLINNNLAIIENNIEKTKERLAQQTESYMKYKMLFKNSQRENKYTD